MNEQEIFLSILEIEDPDSQRAYLRAACADDPELMAKVESLLAFNDAESQFLNTPAIAQIVDLSDAEPPETILADENSTRDDELPKTEFLSRGTDGGIQNCDNEDRKSPWDYLQSIIQPPSRPGSKGRLAHYEIIDVLGRGASGTVLKAVDTKLERLVAIKILAAEMSASSPARKRFLREARSSAAIRHENVVAIHAVEEEPLPYLVMDYIPGQTLQQRLDEKGPLEVRDVVGIGRQIAEGLAAAANQGLIHRDIKPGNILLEAGVQERVKITDFGLACTVDDASVTQSCMVAGTPLYMAPEQALGDKLDHRADLFSLGSVLYHMLSGRPPFQAPSMMAVLKRVTDDAPRPINEVAPDTPQWLCDIIIRLHAKNSDERYQAARDVADALADGEARLKLGTEFLGFAPVPHVTSRSRWVNLKWVVWTLISTLVLLAAPVVTRLFPRHQRALDVASEPAPNVKANVSRQAMGWCGWPADAPKPAIAPFDATQARQYQQAWADYLKLSVEYTNSIGMKLCLIPPGEFTMGSSFDQIARVRPNLPSYYAEDTLMSETPARPVRIDTPFYLGIYPVTVQQFRKFVTATGYKTRPETNETGGWGFSAKANQLVRDPEFTWRKPELNTSEDFPVLCIEYDDAQAFCAWLSQADGRRYEIPHESYWEFACRAGATGLWPWGDQPDDGKSFLHPPFIQSAVGGKPSNAFGIFDMLGNAEEFARANQPSYVGRGRNGNVWENRPATRDIHAERYDAFCSRGFRVVILGDWKPSVVPMDGSPLTDADVERIVALPADQQIEVVSAKLKDLNPGFDGVVTHKIEDATVTELRVNVDKLTDVSPIRIFNRLRVLVCSGTNVDWKYGAGQLADLSSLKGMNLTALTHLDLAFTKVGDEGLALFQDCAALTHLDLNYTRAGDTGLSYFRGCKDLAQLRAANTLVTEAGWVHLRDCSKLVELDLGATQFSDAAVAHWKDYKHLTELHLGWSKLGNDGLAHVVNCQNLRKLDIHRSQVTDLSLLKGLPLTELTCDFVPERDREILKSIETLRQINYQPAAVFWKGLQSK